MTCSCNKENNDADKNDCPSGQSFDVSQGKCVAKENAFGDPKTTDVQADTASDGADTGDKQKVEARDCPEGHTYDAESDTCVPTSSDKTTDIGKTNTDIAKEAIPEWAKALQASISALNEKKPTAEVGSSGLQTWKSVAEGMASSLQKYGKYEFNISLDSLRGVNVAKVNEGGVITEAYRNSPLQLKEAAVPGTAAISGTHAGQDFDTDVAIVPGGLSFKPVFQFAKTKVIGAGADRARFFKTTIPTSGTQLEGETPSTATQTFTSVEVTPSTMTGVYVTVDLDDIENSPFDLLQAVVEGSAASYEDFVADDMLTQISQESALNLASDPRWINGGTGVGGLANSELSDTLTEIGIAAGREYLEDQGYLRGGIKPVMFLHPKQWRDLVTASASNVANLATRSAPDIWIKAELEQFMGVQLVVTNAVEMKTNTVNKVYNAIMCIPKHTYGIGVKRDVTVKMHEIAEQNQIRVNTTWRTKSVIIDALSLVRISSFFEAV